MVRKIARGGGEPPIARLLIIARRARSSLSLLRRPCAAHETYARAGADILFGRSPEAGKRCAEISRSVDTTCAGQHGRGGRTRCSPRGAAGDWLQAPPFSTRTALPATQAMKQVTRVAAPGTPLGGGQHRADAVLGGQLMGFGRLALNASTLRHPEAPARQTEPAPIPPSASGDNRQSFAPLEPPSATPVAVAAATVRRPPAATTVPRRDSGSASLSASSYLRPGRLTDSTAASLQRTWASGWGSRVVVDNQMGASGNIGTRLDEPPRRQATRWCWKAGGTMSQRPACVLQSCPSEPTGRRTFAPMRARSAYHARADSGGQPDIAHVKGAMARPMIALSSRARSGSDRLSTLRAPANATTLQTTAQTAHGCKPRMFRTRAAVGSDRYCWAAPFRWSATMAGAHGHVKSGSSKALAVSVHSAPAPTDISWKAACQTLMVNSWVGLLPATPARPPPWSRLNTG